MRCPRIYQDIALKTGEIVEVDAKAGHYIINVLRLQPGAALRLFNQGNEYHAQLCTKDKRQVSVLIKEEIKPHTESTLQLHLGQGIAKGEKMDWIVQKAVELGVYSITPLLTEHCDVRLPAERFNKRVQHWQAVAVSACEQSGRIHIPLIHPPQSLQQWVMSLKVDICLSFHPGVDFSLQQIAVSPQSIALLIGPEGGVSAAELDFLQQHDFHNVSLGPRILRTETAAIAALTTLQYRWGDLMS